MCVLTQFIIETTPPIFTVQASVHYTVVCRVSIYLCTSLMVHEHRVLITKFSIMFEDQSVEMF